MVDLSAYRDLSETAPENTESADAAVALMDPPPASLSQPSIQQTEPTMNASPSSSSFSSPYAQPAANNAASSQDAGQEHDYDIYGEYSGNVKTLVQLVNDLPEGVTKQTGAQIIRLTMEAMGISMEAVLSDAQAVQSDLLDAVRGNIKKIEEYKTIIRKLETEIRFHQGKANELSEIIDLFILSNATPNMPNLDRSNENY